jgi:hypothetical protein
MGRGVEIQTEGEVNVKLLRSVSSVKGLLTKKSESIRMVVDAMTVAALEAVEQTLAETNRSGTSNSVDGAGMGRLTVCAPVVAADAMATHGPGQCPFAVPSRRGSAPPAHRPFPGAFANGADALPRIPLNTMPCSPLLMSTTDTV